MRLEVSTAAKPLETAVGAAFRRMAPVGRVLPIAASRGWSGVSKIHESAPGRFSPDETRVIHGRCHRPKQQIYILLFD